MSKRLLVLMCSIFLIVPLLFLGCGSDGSDGSNGAPGAPGEPGAPGATGATGATGPAGPISSTNESCMVCHTTSRVADITDAATTDPTGAATVGMHYNAAYEKPFVFIDNITLSNVGGLPKVSFRVRRVSDNAAITTMPSGYPRFMLANLVPGTAAAPQNGYASSMWETWASEQSSTVGGVWDTSLAATGNYAYTFLTPFDNAAVLSPDIDNTQVQRLVIRTSGGTIVNNTVGSNNNATVGVKDFIGVPAPGNNAVFLSYNAHQVVTVDACRKCHGPLLAGAAHGGSYVDTLVCVLCHTPIGNLEGPDMLASGAYNVNFFHKIHAAIPMPAWTSRIGGKGYGAVTYPQDIRDCVVCHTNSNNNLGAGDNTANWKTNPNAAACGSCHVNANFVTGVGHAGGAQPDTTCFVCHPATGHMLPTVGASVTEAHDISPEAVLHPVPANIPEYDVTMTLSPAKAFYVAGDNITITATLVFHGTATPVPTTTYASAQGAAGITDNVLRSATVAAWGPRSQPKPILGLPKPASGLTPQSAGLYVGAKMANGVVNPAVLTDNTGFRYKLTIPAGLASGTYGVRVRFGDYGYVADNNYKIESVAFQKIQIGSTTVEKKLSGDACVNCHGTGDLEAHNARHAVVFDTDQCNSCHDFSGNHADVLNNRVHAVHAASVTGDILVIDWSDVTYPLGLGWPGGIGRCDICHAATAGAADTTPSLLYRSVVQETSCLGCHGDRPGATDHMLQSGGAYGTP